MCQSSLAATDWVSAVQRFLNDGWHIYLTNLTPLQRQVIGNKSRQILPFDFFYLTLQSTVT